MDKKRKQLKPPRKGKVKKAKEEEVNGQGEGGAPAPHGAACC